MLVLVRTVWCRITGIIYGKGVSTKIQYVFVHRSPKVVHLDRALYHLGRFDHITKIISGFEIALSPIRQTLDFLFVCGDNMYYECKYFVQKYAIQVKMSVYLDRHPKTPCQATTMGGPHDGLIGHTVRVIIIIPLENIAGIISGTGGLLNSI